MLLFIGFRTETVISCIWVSIHLMLLFIPLLTSCKWYILCFNTSHVTLYLCKKEKTKEGVKKFQYISCYSLSEVSAIIAGPITRFNTSHVTLYPSTYRKENGMKLFQYISCYSLSYVNKKDKSIIQMFQYISCYSLSNYTENIMEDKASFNTSHVTLYLRELGIAF